MTPPSDRAAAGLGGLRLRSPIRLAALLWLLVVGAAVSGCSNAREVRVELRGAWFTVEIADTDESRARGLMFRDHLPEDRGMLFVFPDEQPRAFWMRNTRIPLDILYFDREFRLVSLHERVPPCGNAPSCPSYPSGRPAQYVLELNAGLARRLGVQTGDRLHVVGLQ